MALIEYKKAFDSVQQKFVPHALKHQVVQDNCIKKVNNIKNTVM